MTSKDTIVEACKNWVENHVGEDLLINYQSVVDLLEVLNKCKNVTHCENCRFSKETVTKYPQNYVFCIKHKKVREPDMFCSEGLEKEGN